MFCSKSVTTCQELKSPLFVYVDVNNIYCISPHVQDA